MIKGLHTKSTRGTVQINCVGYVQRKFIEIEQPKGFGITIKKIWRDRCWHIRLNTYIENNDVTLVSLSSWHLYVSFDNPCVRHLFWLPRKSY